MKRAFYAAATDQRCKFDIKLRDGSNAQCMRYAVVCGYCKQHAKMQQQAQRKKL